MLIDYKVNEIKHPCMEVELEWLGNSFEDFIGRIPPLSIYLTSFLCFLDRVMLMKHWKKF
jgi:hypothetical protein